MIRARLKACWAMLNGRTVIVNAVIDGTVILEKPKSFLANNYIMNGGIVGWKNANN